VDITLYPPLMNEHSEEFNIPLVIEVNNSFAGQTDNPK
jgi:hypothetical protein